MISYKIISKTTPKIDSQKPIKPSPDNPDYLLQVFRKALKHCQFKKGDPVRFVGTSRTATITKIYYDINEITWVKLKPYFIEVMDENEKAFLCTPSQLAKRKL